MQTTYMLIALAAGLIPALFWLWFWLREDAKDPEPRRLILACFAAGMAVVAVALPLQQYAMGRFEGAYLILVWVIIEEILKYSAALVVVLWNRAVDEPIDCIIYMITIALGFSALENALFIFNPLTNGEYLNSFLTSNFRFLGATLLHILASGTVGAFMALAFYQKGFMRVLAATIGLLVAIVLHAVFNFFIMDGSGQTVLVVFMFVWLGIVLLFLLFEKAKLIAQHHV